MILHHLQRYYQKLEAILIKEIQYEFIIEYFKINKIKSGG